MILKMRVPLASIITTLILSTFSLNSKASLDLISYNVENLFDTEHDEGKNDYEYLPSVHPLKEKGCKETSSQGRLKSCLNTNWTEARLELKLNQISRLIHKGFGKLPAVMVVEEIENEKVLGLLARKLGFKGYNISNSPDERGIDMGVMYNPEEGIVFKSFKEHVLTGPIFEQNPTRNILEVHLSTSSGDLFVFANHWPSQGNPVENRVKAAELLKKVMLERSEQFPKALLIATGDFNTIDSDRPEHPIEDVLCADSGIIDLFQNKNKSDVFEDYDKLPKPAGTYYYKKDRQWNFLDRFFVLKNNKKEGLKVKADSHRIIAPYFAMKIFTPGGSRNPSQMIGIPWASNHNADFPELAGFSDHFAIALTFE